MEAYPPATQEPRYPQGPARKWGCQECQAQNAGDQCRHCFKCGSADHYIKRVPEPFGKRQRVTANGPFSTYWMRPHWMWEPLILPQSHLMAGLKHISHWGKGEEIPSTTLLVPMFVTSDTTAEPIIGYICHWEDFQTTWRWHHMCPAKGRGGWFPKMNSSSIKTLVHLLHDAGPDSLCTVWVGKKDVLIPKGATKEVTCKELTCKEVGHRTSPLQTTNHLDQVTPAWIPFLSDESTHDGLPRLCVTIHPLYGCIQWGTQKYQRQQNKQRVISYGSRTSHQQRKTTNEVGHLWEVPWIPILCEDDLTTHWHYVTEIRHIWARNQIELVIDNESRDLQLYNDSFLILIGHAKAELRHFKVCLYENSKQLF